VGRQPWVVYRVMRTDQAVTAASGIPVSYAVLSLAYLVLIAAVAWTLWRLASIPLRSPAG
jgi:cytochrome d ubiquinol oxidase subunit I